MFGDFAIFQCFKHCVLSLGVVYTSFGQLVLGTEAIEFGHLIMIGIGASLPTLVMSAIKKVNKVKFL
ncbi:hypothetical protein [Vibrio bivalvicida]|uniref:Uncharacterized protein n=1 Tax=Vibrio bivalvicida TaxID=1276888 RepID=A0ABV4MJY0_9VIBR